MVLRSAAENDVESRSMSAPLSPSTERLALGTGHYVSRNVSTSRRMRQRCALQVGPHATCTTIDKAEALRCIAWHFTTIARRFGKRRSEGHRRLSVTPGTSTSFISSIMLCCLRLSGACLGATVQNIVRDVICLVPLVHRKGRLLWDCRAQKTRSHHYQHKQFCTALKITPEYVTQKTHE